MNFYVETQYGESLVFVQSSDGSTALIAAFRTPEAAQELADFFNKLADLNLRSEKHGN